MFSNFTYRRVSRTYFPVEYLKLTLADYKVDVYTFLIVIVTCPSLLEHSELSFPFEYYYLTFFCTDVYEYKVLFDKIISGEVILNHGFVICNCTRILGTEPDVKNRWILIFTKFEKYSNLSKVSRKWSNDPWIKVQRISSCS